eukprot:6319325-Amphidinium_carterae.1
MFHIIHEQQVSRRHEEADETSRKYEKPTHATTRAYQYNNDKDQKLYKKETRTHQKRNHNHNHNQQYPSHRDSLQD